MAHIYHKNKKASNKRFQNKIDKKHNETTNELVNKIKFLFKKNNFDQALNVIDEYLIIHPDDMYIQTYKAMTLFRIGRIDESKSLFEMVLNCDYLAERVRLFAMSQYANILSMMHNNNLAIYYLECVINEASDLQLIARGKLSYMYADVERYTDAINILKIDGFNNKFLNMKRSKIFFKMGNYGRAIKALEQEECNDYNYHVNENFDDKFIDQEECYIKGHAFYKLNKLNQALFYLSKANSNKNMSIYYKANMDIVRIYILRMQLDDAINLCEDCIRQAMSDYYKNIFQELLGKCYLKKNDYEKAKEKYEGIDISDELRKINLGNLELLKGNFDKAEEYFSIIDVENIIVKDNYQNLYKLLLIKYRLKKYDEALYIIDILEQNLDKYEIKQMQFELDRIKLYIYVKQNKEFDKEVEMYSSKQIISYDKNEAINHIVDHHYVNVKTSKFNDNIDIEKLFNEASSLMDKEKIIYDSMFDKYIVKYPNIGTNKNNENIHQLCILTLPDTNDIITMYPCDGTESIYNLEELEETTKPKVKRLSQIEKFNKKYGNN